MVYFGTSWKVFSTPYEFQEFSSAFKNLGSCTFICFYIYISPVTKIYFDQIIVKPLYFNKIAFSQIVFA